MDPSGHYYPHDPTLPLYSLPMYRAYHSHTRERQNYYPHSSSSLGWAHSKPSPASHPKHRPSIGYIRHTRSRMRCNTQRHAQSGCRGGTTCCRLWRRALRIGVVFHRQWQSGYECHWRTVILLLYAREEEPSRLSHRLGWVKRTYSFQTHKQNSPQQSHKEYSTL